MDKGKVQRAFAEASATYDKAAHLQREIGYALLATLSEPTALQGKVMDLGCGTGFLSRELLTRGWCNAANLFAVDIALPMLQASRHKLAGICPPYYLCADAEQLPFADNSLQHIFSNLALQWCRPLVPVCAEFQRVLSPGGQLCFSTFGPKTLQELKAAWRAVDNYQHVNDFYDANYIEDILKQSGMDNISVQSNVYVNYYPSVLALLQELKNLGAQTVSARSPHTTSKARWQTLLAAYVADTQSGFIPASFEIIKVRATT